MSFVHEYLTEEEKIVYAEQLSGWKKDWYIDKDKDISIWISNDAKNWQELAEGNDRKLVRLRIRKQVIYFLLKLGSGSNNFSEKPYIIVWDFIVYYEPKNLFGYDLSFIIDLLKEALIAWGGGYENNTNWHPDYIVKFNF